MQPRAPLSDDSPARGAWGPWRALARHQLGAAAATLIDFGTMVVLVQRFDLSPVLGTTVSAPLGGIVNFALGRSWVFPNNTGRIEWQAVRYALVSAASAAWNAVGEHVVHDLAHVQYVLARALVAIAVSLAWNFPMQRGFVFSQGAGR